MKKSKYFIKVTIEILKKKKEKKQLQRSIEGENMDLAAILSYVFVKMNEKPLFFYIF